MTCGEFKDQAGALAAGALDAGEREACERHLAGSSSHEGCEEALRRSTEAAALLAVALTPAPVGDQLWRAIEAQVAPRRQSAPARPRWSRPVRFAAAAIAAVALLAFGTLIGSGQVGGHNADQEQLRVVAALLEDSQRDLKAAEQELRAERDALEMMQQPETKMVPLAPQGGAAMSATALYNPKDGHALVMAKGLAAHDAHDYELWVIRGDKKMSAGLLHGDAHGAAFAHIDQKLLASGAPDAFAVTLEPAGGGPVPRGPIMLVGSLPKS